MDLLDTTLILVQEVAIMNNYTTEDILKTLDNRIDYNEIARVLELDLNQIANAI